MKNTNTNLSDNINYDTGSQYPSDCGQHNQLDNSSNNSDIYIHLDDIAVSEAPNSVSEQRPQAIVYINIKGDRLGAEERQVGESVKLAIPLRNGCIQINVGNKSIPALIDTGATVSFINPKLVLSLINSGHNVILARHHTKVALADNTVYTISKRATLDINIQGTTFKHSFLVLGTLNRPIILGLNFLKQQAAEIDFKDHQPQHNTPSLRTKRKITIPALTEITLNVDIMSTQQLNGLTGLITAHDHPTPFLLRDALVTPFINANGFTTTVATIVNPTDDPMTLDRGTVLGEWHTQNPDEYTPLQLHNITDTENTQTAGLTPINSGDEPPIDRTDPNAPLNYILPYNLSQQQKEQMTQLVDKHREAFVTSDNVIGLKTDFKVSIDLKPGAIPSNRTPYKQHQ